MTPLTHEARGWLQTSLLQPAFCRFDHHRRVHSLTACIHTYAWRPFSHQVKTWLAWRPSQHASCHRMAIVSTCHNCTKSSSLLQKLGLSPRMEQFWVSLEMDALLLKVEVHVWTPSYWISELRRWVSFRALHSNASLSFNFSPWQSSGDADTCRKGYLHLDAPTHSLHASTKATWVNCWWVLKLQPTQSSTCSP